MGTNIDTEKAAQATIHVEATETQRAPEERKQLPAKKRTVEPENQRKPAKVIVHPTGSGKRYGLLFQVLDTDDLPVSKAVIRLLNVYDPDELVDLPATGGDGTVQHSVTVTGKYCKYQAFVLGSAVSKEIIFHGGAE